MADISIDQQIIEAIRRLDDSQKRQVLNYVRQTLRQKSSYAVWELLQLPPDERERQIASAFEAAAQEDFEVFEAYSQEDLDE